MREFGKCQRVKPSVLIRVAKTIKIYFYTQVNSRDWGYVYYTSSGNCGGPGILSICGLKKKEGSHEGWHRMFGKRGLNVAHITFCLYPLARAGHVLHVDTSRHKKVVYLCAQDEEALMRVCSCSTTAGRAESWNMNWI